MLRVAKPTSPMSVGTWILTAYGPLAGAAAAGDLADLLPRPLTRLGAPLRVLAAPAGIGAAALGGGVASYTAVLLANTATPAWHEARRELPFVFVGSAAASAGGLGMLGAPVVQAGPARRLAAAGVAVEYVAARSMRNSMGISAEALHSGRAGRLMTAGRVLGVAGAAAGLVVGRRSRPIAALSGAALLAGAGCLRFAVFEAGQVSARDPRFTVVPQRQRVERRAAGSST
jgi:formate-dependent nitrite reductase membrane component NrfD